MSEEMKVEEQEAKAAEQKAIPETLSVDIEADEKCSGIKEVAVNLDALAGIQGMQGVQDSETTASPSFFVSNTDRYKLELDVLFDRETGKITSISRKDLGIDFSEFDFFAHTEVWFEFSIPSYQDISTYRQRCSSYRRDAGKVLVDSIQMRNFLIVWHLKDWSLQGKDGKKVELTQNAEGALDDDSLAHVYAVSPSLIDVVLTNLEKDIILTT